MARTCTVCAHPQREAVERAIVAGESSRAVVARYGTKRAPLGRMAIQRHTAEHLPATLVKAAEQEDVAHAIDLAQQLFRINAAAWAILDEARQAGRPETALRAIDRVVKTLEVQVKITETQEFEERITTLEEQRAATPPPQRGVRPWR